MRHRRPHTQNCTSTFMRYHWCSLVPVVLSFELSCLSLVPVVFHELSLLCFFLHCSGFYVECWHKYLAETSWFQRHNLPDREEGPNKSSKRSTIKLLTKHDQAQTKATNKAQTSLQRSTQPTGRGPHSNRGRHRKKYRQVGRCGRCGIPHSRYFKNL